MKVSVRSLLTLIPVAALIVGALALAPAADAQTGPTSCPEGYSVVSAGICGAAVAPTYSGDRFTVGIRLITQNEIRVVVPSGRHGVEWLSTGRRTVNTPAGQAVEVTMTGHLTEPTLTGRWTVSTAPETWCLIPTGGPFITGKCFVEEIQVVVTVVDSSGPQSFNVRGPGESPLATSR